MTLNDRLRELILQNIGEYRRFKQLEIQTGIQADSWKSWYHNRQRPTMEMIEAAFKIWPQHAFWLATGRADSKNGHLALDTVDAIEIKRESVLSF